jgi:hypothetical protein
MTYHPDMLKNSMATQDAFRLLIARSVDSTIREYFPERYLTLCHDYAIIGSNVVSIALGRQYRPVAGLAKFDCGNGNFINFTDDLAFFKEGGGAFHCWIESSTQDRCDKEIIDFSFMHKEKFAAIHNMAWRKMPSNYLWGLATDLVIDAELNNLPPKFPDGKVWLRETQNGIGWMNQRIAAHVEYYVSATALALKKIKQESELLF